MEVDKCKKDLQQAQYPRLKLDLAVHHLLIRPIQPIKNTNVGSLAKLRLKSQEYQ